MTCQQELSYRKQIVRQQRTQYAEEIYRHKYYTVTLKSRLRVTQGHWKQNHWIYHARLRLRSKSRSDRLLQLTRLVGGANLDHKYRFQ